MRREARRRARVVEPVARGAVPVHAWIEVGADRARLPDVVVDRWEWPLAGPGER